jgi:hypothetical protein
MSLFWRRLSGLRSLLLLTSAVMLAVGVMTTGIAPGTASPASAAPVVTICLKNSPSFCADVKNSRDVSGQPVWLYRRSAATDFHWYEVVPPCAFSCQPGCSFTACVEFEDVQNPSLCLAASASEWGDLIACHFEEGGTGRAVWIPNGNKLRNNFWTAANLSVRGPLKNGRLTFVTTVTGSGIWQAWTGQ